MTDQFEVVRLVAGHRRIASTLSGVSRHWQGEKESFLFVSPHDDDTVFGAGLLVLATDGSMGYCSEEERQSIVDIRRKETFNCYQHLGVAAENIHWLGYPDCNLYYHRGRREASTDDATAIEGFTGLQNAFTYHIRKAKPTQCFLPTSSDLHPDHKIVHEEFLISLYHARGAIWPELGPPVEKIPSVHEFACYCNFPEPPDLQIKTSPELLQKKLESIAEFKSQKQIDADIEIIKRAGPVEYIRDLHFKLYSPEIYREMFEER